MKKILAMLMAVLMLVSFAACGGNNNEEETTTNPEVVTDAPVNSEGEEVTDAPEVENETEAEEVTEEGETEAEEATEEGETEAEEETKKEDKPADKPAKVEKLTADKLASLMNSATKAVVSNGSYSYNRVCAFVPGKGIDVGDKTATLNKLIGMVADDANLDSVVGGFIGIGTKQGTMPKDKDSLKDNYEIKATALKGSDIQNLKEANGVYSFTIANATDPQKDNKTPVSRFTNDFITHKEVVDGIADALGGLANLLTVNSTKVNYKSIEVEVTVKDGKITNIAYSYTFDAVLNLKALGVKIDGTGTATTNGEFSNIKY
ncbi:MAG: hypothetical protein IKL16_00295 [Clostridia bacterium]|nr:hypothetical protein [Clostridia bacterium]